VYINDTDNVKTVNNTMSYTCGAGIYDIQIAYYDMFGEGEKSAEARVVVKIEIDESMIKNEAITLKKIDSVVKEYIDQGVEAKNQVVQLVGNLNKDDGAQNYSALVQLSDAINMRVKEGDVVNQINVSPESILIDGKKIHVTGDTTFDSNIITKGMIQAGAVSADKMAVDSLSAITANMGSITGGTITGGTINGGTIIGATIRNSSSSFVVDENGNITGASLTSGNIDGTSVKISGYEVHATAIVKGQIADGNTIPLPTGYTIDQCVFGTSSPGGNNGEVLRVNYYTGKFEHYYMNYDNGANRVSMNPNYYWVVGVK
jgi:hypothetical protein